MPVPISELPSNISTAYPDMNTSSAAWCDDHIYICISEKLSYQNKRQKIVYDIIVHTNQRNPARVADPVGIDLDSEPEATLEQPRGTRSHIVTSLYPYNLFLVS